MGRKHFANSATMMDIQQNKVGRRFDCRSGIHRRPFGKEALVFKPFGTQAGSGRDFCGAAFPLAFSVIGKTAQDQAVLALGEVAQGTRSSPDCSTKSRALRMATVWEDRFFSGPVHFGGTTRFPSIKEAKVPARRRISTENFLKSEAALRKTPAVLSLLFRISRILLRNHPGSREKTLSSHRKFRVGWADFRSPGSI